MRRGDDLTVYACERSCRDGLAEDGVEVGAWDGQRPFVVGDVYAFTKIVIP